MAASEVPKKPDSVMRFSSNGTADDVFLTPRDYAGYAVLSNEVGSFHLTVSP